MGGETLDPVTHALAGLTVASLSGAELSFTSPAYLASLLGSLAPDLDILLQFRGHLTYLKYHRGPSHALPGLVLSALAVTFLLRPYFPEVASTSMFFWGFAGTLTHTLLDILNSYGAKPFWPLSNRNVTANLLTIFDPVLALGLTTFLFGQARRSLSYISLVLVVVYLAGRWLMLRRVQGFLQHKFSEEVKRVAVLPSMLSIWNWAFLVETAVGYVVGDIPSFAPTLHVRRWLPKPSSTQLIGRALTTKLGQLFTDFTPLFYISCQEEDDHSIVKFVDLRYFVRDDFLHSATLVFDEDQRPLEGLFHPYNPERKIKVAV